MWNYTPMSKYNGFWSGKCPECGSYMSFSKWADSASCTTCHSEVAITHDKDSYPSSLKVTSLIYKGESIHVSKFSPLSKGSYAQGLTPLYLTQSFIGGR